MTPTNRFGFYSEQAERYAGFCKSHLKVQTALDKNGKKKPNAGQTFIDWQPAAQYREANIYRTARLSAHFGLMALAVQEQPAVTLERLLTDLLDDTLADIDQQQDQQLSTLAYVEALEAQVQALVGFMRTELAGHDGDCGAYPAAAHGQPVHDGDCDCHVDKVRDLLVQLGLEPNA